MNAQQLSERLKCVASFVPKGAVVADIGSDHAYLPCYLVHQGTANAAVAGEVVQGPYDSARLQVQTEGLQDRITVRLADGLKAVRPEDGVTVVTIAGMGGTLIRSILETGREALSGVERLILQPNIHAQTIREWALENGWSVTDEAILKENGKIYEVVVLDWKPSPPLAEEELLFGPFLLQRKGPVFKEKWTREWSQWNAILRSMENAEETPELARKKQELEQRIRLAEGVLADEDTERS